MDALLHGAGDWPEPEYSELREMVSEDVMEIEPIIDDIVARAVEAARVR